MDTLYKNNKSRTNFKGSKVTAYDNQMYFQMDESSVKKSSSIISKDIRKSNTVTYRNSPFFSNSSGQIKKNNVCGNVDTKFFDKCKIAHKNYPNKENSSILKTDYNENSHLVTQNDKTVPGEINRMDEDVKLNHKKSYIKVSKNKHAYFGYGSKSNRLVNKSEISYDDDENEISKQPNSKREHYNQELRNRLSQLKDNNNNSHSGWNLNSKDDYSKRQKVNKLKDYQKSVQSGKFDITAHYDSSIFKNINASTIRNTHEKNLPKVRQGILIFL